MPTYEYECLDCGKESEFDAHAEESRERWRVRHAKISRWSSWWAVHGQDQSEKL